MAITSAFCNLHSLINDQYRVKTVKEVDKKIATPDESAQNNPFQRIPVSLFNYFTGYFLVIPQVHKIDDLIFLWEEPVAITGKNILRNDSDRIISGDHA